MNARSSATSDAARKLEIYELLREICEELDITESQYQQARTAYGGISEWLAACDLPLFKGAEIYAHGSIGLRTAAKPLSGDEFDVDLICHFPSISADVEPATVKKLLGDRLRENDRYARMLIEKKRCWRLVYAGLFHADIAPTIPNVVCANGGELVPDKAAKTWKPTHPRGYRRLFDKRAALTPRLRVKKLDEAYDFRADIAPFPEYGAGRALLRRLVQLLKRHRDVSFEHVDADVAPISIIITTLAARAYQIVVGLSGLNTEFDVLEATIMMMPHFVDIKTVNGKTQYVVTNETTTGENFADRWNSEPRRARAFFGWHKRVLEDVQSLPNIEGHDRAQEALSRMLGERIVTPVFEKRVSTISSARASGSLYVAPKVGLTTVPTMGSASLIRSNTFFGR